MHEPDWWSNLWAKQFCSNWSKAHMGNACIVCRHVRVCLEEKIGVNKGGEAENHVLALQLSQLDRGSMSTSFRESCVLWNRAWVVAKASHQGNFGKNGGVGESRWMFLINNQPRDNLHKVYSACQTQSINKALKASSKHLPLEKYFYETYITDKALGLHYYTFAILKEALWLHRGIVYSAQSRNFRCCSSELAEVSWKQ